MVFSTSPWLSIFLRIWFCVVFANIPVLGADSNLTASRQVADNPNEQTHVGQVEAVEPDKHSRSIMLRNAAIAMTVDPAIGRITDYHQLGQANWLWVDPDPETKSNGWVNYGGSRVWLVPQFLRYQVHGRDVPTPAVDGQPWTVLQRSGRRLVMRSEVSEPLGIWIQQTINLPDDGTRVVQTFEVHRQSPSPFPVHVWNIAQVSVAEGRVWVESFATPPHGETSSLHVSRTTPKDAIKHFPQNETICIAKTSQTGFKVWTWGQWVGYVRGKEAFLQTVTFDSSACYLDKGNCQVYVDGGRGFIELESVSPAWWLRPGESKQWTVVWQIVSLEAGPIAPQLHAITHGLKR